MQASNAINAGTRRSSKWQERWGDVPTLLQFLPAISQAANTFSIYTEKFFSTMIAFSESLATSSSIDVFRDLAALMGVLLRE